ncbi:MAG TPA: ATP-binding protein [Dehalococcoidia bacterium]|nr:ATP-binding protein [Dehalococcoidia bacterium]
MVLAFRLTGSIRRATDAAVAIRSGDASHHLDTRGSGGAAALNTAFNQMAQNVRETLQNATEAESRLIAALDASIDAILALDRGARITFANDAARKLFGPRGEDLVGSPVAYFVPDDRLVGALRSSSEGHTSLSLTIERPNKSYLQAVTTPITGGGDWAALVVFHDLSETLRTEQMRRDFIANVSHELRTPLAAIKSVIETLESGAKDEPESAAGFLSLADSEVDRLVQMVEELLELSRLESGDLSLACNQLDIAAILHSAVERMRRQAERAGLQLSLEVSPALPPVSGDADVIERAVVNLVHNAVKFTPEGGAIRVSASPADGAVSITVNDTGVGIPPEDLPRIFERFYKGDRSRGGSGTGLGLAVARHAAEAHGGSIHALSQPGEGSTFTLSLPADASPS